MAKRNTEGQPPKGKKCRYYVTGWVKEEKKDDNGKKEVNNRVLMQLIVGGVMVQEGA